MKLLILRHDSWQQRLAPQQMARSGQEASKPGWSQPALFIINDHTADLAHTNQRQSSICGALLSNLTSCVCSPACCSIRPNSSMGFVGVDQEACKGCSNVGRYLGFKEILVVCDTG